MKKNKTSAISKEKNDIISVIVPIYRVEKYLDQCISSIVNQQYKNLEIILIDDGSPDNCPSKCDEWAKKDNRIIVKHIKNGGVSNARNVGLKLSTGNYISFVDADDYLEHNMYSTMMEEFKENNHDLVICNFFLKYEDSRKNNTSTFKIPNKMNKNEYLKLMCKNEGFSGYLWNRLYKREALFSNNRSIEFNTELKLMEDFLFNCKIIDNIENIGYINACLYNYRQRTDSVLHSDFKLLIPHSMKVLPLISEALEENKIKECNKYKLIYIFESQVGIYYDINDLNYNEINKNVKKYIWKDLAFAKKGDFKLKIKSLLVLINPKLYFLLKK